MITPRKILVVDDEPDMEMLIRQKFRKQISSGTYLVSFAQNGREALNKLAEDQSIDLVMSDINMPVMNGLELLEKVAALQLPCKCIVVSAYNDVQNIRTAMNRGAFDFVTKPIDFNDLEKTIEKTLGAVDEVKDATLARSERDSAIVEKEQAVSSEKFKQQFLANMSHEIRTPMNSVIGLTHLLLKTNLTEDQSKYLNMIMIASEQLMSIINDILDLSKIEAGKFVFESIPFHLEGAIQNVKNMLELKAQEKQLNIELDILPAASGYFLGDPTRLSQILINLVGNAIKFTHEGKITISVDYKKDSNDNSNLYFKVKDTGIGISGEHLDKVFQSFTQAENNTSRKFGGTGLGLTISKQLVELQGGQIGVESTPGIGTTFFFNLPYPKAEKQETVSKEHVDFEDLQEIHILLTEDNDFNKVVAEDTIMEYLKKATITHASNGQEALDKIAQERFDVVLMDIQMPVMDGYEAMQHIRSQEAPENPLPVIAMTANATPEEVNKCFESGADGYVSKPFIPDDLFREIGRVIGKYR